MPTIEHADLRYTSASGSQLNIRSPLFQQDTHEYTLWNKGVVDEYILGPIDPVYDEYINGITRLAREFLILARQWQRETGIYSSIARRANHPAYQRIINMGRRAIPLILRELEARPDHWFWALHAITGEDPTPNGGNFHDAVHAWLQWGKTHGYSR